jgi:hypothetical protein
MNDPRHCLYCESELLSGEDYRKKFCNSSCAAKYNNPKRAVVILCKNCGKQITTGSRKQKCCSVHCRDDYRIKGKLRIGSMMNKSLRKWLYINLKQICCECNIGPEWNNKPLRLQIDHKNGNVKDNRLENLRMICPNCHTQTETWGVRNASDEGKIKMALGWKNRI